MGGHIYSPDGELLFRTTESLVENRSFAVFPLMGFGTRTGKDGQEYAQYGIGQPIAAIPFYLAGRAAEGISDGKFLIPVFENTTQYHSRLGKEYLRRFYVSFFNLFVSALTVVLLATFAWWVSGDMAAAIITGVLYGCGSLALPHSRTFFSEPLAALMVLASLFYLFKAMNFRKPRYTVIAGIAFGYGLLTRLDSLFFLPGLLLFIFLENMRFHHANRLKGGFVRVQFKKEALAHWFSFFIPIILSLTVILLLNYTRFGHLFATGYEDQPEGVRFSTPLLVGLYGFLFSVGKGLFFFSPVLILFFFGIKRLMNEWRNLAWALLVMILGFLLIQSRWQNWAGGWCWGPRHIFQIHVLLALPAVMVLMPPRTPILRIFVAVVLCIGFFVQLYGSSQNFIDFYMDYYRTPQYTPNAYVLYSLDETDVLAQAYNLSITAPQYVAPSPMNFTYLQAPINDSIYIVQNSQWYRYLSMWKEGKTDFFWLRLLRM